jgi:AcrR family transcriptional regulator
MYGKLAARGRSGILGSDESRLGMSSSRTTAPARRRRAPRGTLSPDAIVQAATEVIGTDGLDALTIRRLADDLGVRPMSLYTHFRDKDAILRAVAEQQLSHLRVSEPMSSPIDQLGQIMRAYYRLLIEHPVLLHLDAAFEGMTPAQARFTEEIHTCLRPLGIPPQTAVGLVATLARYVIGAAYVYPTRSAWDEDPDHWNQVRARWAALPPEEYPSMHAVAADYPSFSQQDVFEFGLRTLLDAIAAKASGGGR